MANIPIVSQSEVRKIVLFSSNGNGTLSPTPINKNNIADVPILQWSEVEKIWVFVGNANGMLSPTVLN